LYLFTYFAVDIFFSKFPSAVRFFSAASSALWQRCGRTQTGFKQNRFCLAAKSGYLTQRINLPAKYHRPITPKSTELYIINRVCKGQWE
jgi:hypothetical protein